MVRVFSFTIFGSADKYCKGLLRNIELIQTEFPDFETWVYIGNDVPAHILNQLYTTPKVRCFFTGEVGLVNKFYRFFAIDDPEVDVMFVRDVDSRILNRDISTIHEFLASDKKFHLVRDHPNHFHKVMACSFAIRKGCMAVPLKPIFDEYRQTNEVTTFWNDQEFLAAVFWPRVTSYSMIHDDLHEFEPLSMKTQIKAPIGDGLHFIGQVYEFDENGNEYAKFTDFFEGGVHGTAFWTPERLQRVSVNEMSKKGVNLFVQVYRYPFPNDMPEDEKKKKTKRHAELDICFQVNINHPFVKKATVFYEKEDDKIYYEELIKAGLDKVTFVKQSKQPHYKDFLIYIRDTMPQDEVCCVLASDIYLNFDIDVSFFDRFLPVNTVFGITRHEPTDKYHTICNEASCSLIHSAGGCADCFIFRTPIPAEFDYESIDHKQNRWGGECSFLSAWHKAGAKVLNPCFQVKTIHVHENNEHFNMDPTRVAYGRPYLPDLEPPPNDSNHCINRPCALYPPGEVVCFRCYAYPNVFCRWHKGGRDWTCSICEMYNKFEEREWALQRAANSTNLQKS
jgi:hypothetical protein